MKIYDGDVFRCPECGKKLQRIQNVSLLHFKRAMPFLIGAGILVVGAWLLQAYITKDNESAGRTAAVFPPSGSLAPGDSCDLVHHHKYNRLHDGKGGFMAGQIIDSNSADCGFVATAGRKIKGSSRPERGTAAGGYLCLDQSKWERLHDGAGGYIKGRLLEANSAECGYAPPVYATKPTERRAETRIVTETKPAPAKPAVTKPRETAAKPRAGQNVGKPYCGTGSLKGSLVQRKSNGEGGTYEEVIEPCSEACDCVQFISPRQGQMPTIRRNN